MPLRLLIEAFLPSPPQDNSRAGADKISITRKSYDGKGPNGHRIWTVLVAINASGIERTLMDIYRYRIRKSH